MRTPELSRDYRFLWALRNNLPQSGANYRLSPVPQAGRIYIVAHTKDDRALVEDYLDAGGQEYTVVQSPGGNEYISIDWPFDGKAVAEAWEIVRQEVLPEVDNTDAVDQISAVINDIERRSA